VSILPWKVGSEPRSIMKDGRSEPLRPDVIEDTVGEEAGNSTRSILYRRACRLVVELEVRYNCGQQGFARNFPEELTRVALVT
jgi:hypothetical protein